MRIKTGETAIKNRLRVECGIEAESSCDLWEWLRKKDFGGNVSLKLLESSVQYELSWYHYGEDDCIDAILGVNPFCALGKFIILLHRFEAKVAGPKYLQIRPSDFPQEDWAWIDISIKPI